MESSTKLKSKIKSILSFFGGRFIQGFSLLFHIYIWRKIKVNCKKGMRGATGNIYTKLQDFNEMMFLLHFLDDSMYFIDVGQILAHILF